MAFGFIVIQDLLSQVTLQVLKLFAYCQTKQKATLQDSPPAPLLRKK